MQVSRNKDGSFSVYNVFLFGHALRGNWLRFTPLQPVLDTMRLLDCVPMCTRIPGVGYRYGKSISSGGLTSYELED